MKIVWLTLFAAALPSVMGNPVPADSDDANNEARAAAGVGKYASYGNYPPPKGGYGKYGKYASYGKYPRDAEAPEEE